MRIISGLFLFGCCLFGGAAEIQSVSTPLTAPSVLRRSARLLRSGETLEILHPDTETGRSAARVIAEAITGATGHQPIVRVGKREDRLAAKPAVLLGNLFNNPALELLYAREQVATDEFHPGPGGYIVETLIEPVKRDADLLIVGASDDAGLLLAAKIAASAIAEAGKPGSLALPVLFLRHYTTPPDAPEVWSENYLADGLEHARKILKEGIHTSLGGEFARIADRYRLFRNPLDAKLFVEVAKLYRADAAENPGKFGGAWGFDSDFPSYQALTGWDVIEHDPSLTDEERFEAEKTLLRWLEEAIAAEALLGLNYRGPLANHITFAATSAMIGALYFEKNHPAELPQIPIWLDAINKVMRRQTTATKVYDDCDGYGWLTWRHTLLYSLALPDDTVFENGVAKSMIKLMLTTMDPMGLQVPYGDCDEWASWGTCLSVLDIYYARTRDPLTGYLLERKRPVYRLIRDGRWLPLYEIDLASTTGDRPSFRGFGGKITASAKPEITALASVIPLDKEYQKVEHHGYASAPMEKAFDKFAWRESFDPRAFYLLIDGVNNGGHFHADSGSVVRFTQYNRQWLCENSYAGNRQQFHNTLLAEIDGEAFALPDFAELPEYGENNELSWAKISPGAMGPAQWVRYLFRLKKEDVWCVVDEVTANRTGHYHLTQRWNALGELTNFPGGIELRQQGEAMRLTFDPGAKIEHKSDPALAAGWKSYPYAEPVARVIDRIFDGTLEKGKKIRLASLWNGGKSGIWKVESDDDALFLIGNGRRCRISFDAPGEAPPKPFAQRPGSVWRSAAIVGGTLIAGDAAGMLCRFDQSGNILWERKLPAMVNAITGDDFDGDGKVEVAAGLDNGEIDLFDGDGKALWKRQLDFYRVAPKLRVLRTADLDGDGKPELVAGADSWKLYAFDQTGNMLWEQEIVREVRSLEIADLDGDGQNEVIGGTNYYYLTALDKRGAKLWGGKFGVGAPVLTSVAMPEKKERLVVAGLSDGKIAFLDARGRESATFNAGDEITGIALIGENILASSRNGVLYGFDMTGRKRFFRRMGKSIEQLLAITPSEAALLSDGQVHLVNADGIVQKTIRVATSRCILASSGNILYILTEEGTIEAIDTLKMKH